MKCAVCEMETGVNPGPMMSDFFFHQKLGDAECGGGVVAFSPISKVVCKSCASKIASAIQTVSAAQYGQRTFGGRMFFDPNCGEGV